LFIYIVATALACAGAWLAVVRWPGLQGALDRAIAWLLLIPTLLTAVTLGLGLLGLLTPKALLAAHLAVAVAAAAYWWWTRPAGRTGAGETRPFGVRWRLLWQPLRSQPWLWPVWLGWAAAMAWAVFVALAIPPYGWDGLSYHLPPAVWWLQDHRISPAPSQFVFGYAYPQGMSLLLIWQIAFTATDHLVNVVQVPFVLLGLVAAYGLAREAGLGRPWALWAAAFWATTPLVLAQSTVPYNDTAIAALTVTALYWVLRAWRLGSGQSGGQSRRWALVSLAGCAVALLTGIKANGFLTVGLVGLLALLPWPRERRRWLPHAVGAAIAIGVPCLLLAGYWYIRNLVLYHNPIYPVAVNLLGHTIFPGTRSVAQLINNTPGQTPWQTFVLALQEAAARYSYDSTQAGYGPVFTCLGLGAMAAALLDGARRRRWRLVAVLAVGLILLVLQPFKYPRYVLHLPVVAGIGFGYVMQRLTARPLRHLFQAVAAGMALFTLFLIPAQPQLSAEDLWQVRTARAEGRPLQVTEFGHSRHYYFFPQTPGLFDPANRIAFTELEFVYPLQGRDEMNVTYYIPPTSYEQWLHEVMAKRTTFLFVARDKAVEKQWAAGHPEVFVPWARVWPVTVYLVRSDEPRNRALLNSLTGGGRP
jgi:4-amino-4-deoxy-L-arabinose transferase-like glycosyltransferase